MGLSAGQARKAQRRASGDRGPRARVYPPEADLGPDPERWLGALGVSPGLSWLTGSWPRQSLPGVPSPSRLARRLSVLPTFAPLSWGHFSVIG